MSGKIDAVLGITQAIEAILARRRARAKPPTVLPYRDGLSAADLALASVACERAALLPHAEYMTGIAEKLRAEGDRRLAEAPPAAAG